ncbi:MAG: signal peptidase I [Dongiaceae bacterium]
MTSRTSGGLMEIVRTIVYAILIAFVVRTFAFEPFNIPSGSMKPTLLVGDYLFVTKWTYGYSRYSFLWGWPAFSGRIGAAPVTRGDVVVFKVPSDNETDYIKRIVGLPGDRIQVIGGILHINGEPVKREPIDDWVDSDGQSFTQYDETLPNGVIHHIVEASDRAPLDDTDEFLVPPGNYFGMGDNRDNSQDSRVFGFIPEENLVGRASFIFYSTTGAGRWWEVWNWLPRTRLGRLFSGIT